MLHLVCFMWNVEFNLPTFCMSIFSKTISQIFMKLQQEQSLGGVDMPLAIRNLIIYSYSLF